MKKNQRRKKQATKFRDLPQKLHSQAKADWQCHRLRKAPCFSLKLPRSLRSQAHQLATACLPTPCQRREKPLPSQRKIRQEATCFNSLLRSLKSKRKKKHLLKSYLRYLVRLCSLMVACSETRILLRQPPILWQLRKQQSKSLLHQLNQRHNNQSLQRPSQKQRQQSWKKSHKASKPKKKRRFQAWTHYLVTSQLRKTTRKSQKTFLLRHQRRAT